MINRSVYPDEHCVDLKKSEKHWFEDLIHEPEYIDVFLHFAHIYTNVRRSNQLKVAILVHANETITMLRGKLSDPNQMISDSTIFTILVLAVTSESMEGIEATQKHLDGLHQLVTLRGGIAMLSRKRFLQIECCRFVYSHRLLRAFC
jgi:hypothetical protein